MSDTLFDIKHDLVVSICVTVVSYIFVLMLRLYKKKRAGRLMATHMRKNLKADYNYLDHASDNYQLSECKFSISNDKEYHLPEVSNQGKECVMVNYLFHNRMQEIVMDEKHYFYVSFFYSDYMTKEHLRKTWIDNPRIIDQPKDMNDLYPMVLGLKLSVMMYYRWRGTFYFIHSNNSFVIEHLFDCSDADFVFSRGDIVSGYKIEKLLLAKIIESGFEVRPSERYNGFTDIGVDDDELYLRLFYFVEIRKPENRCVEIGKVKEIPRFIKKTPKISKAFKSSLVKLNLLYEAKVWD